MTRAINIFYATGNGNARRVAQKLEEQLLEEGLSATRRNLRDCDLNVLQETGLAVFFVSTWGEGDPPPDAEAFFDAVAQHENPLSKLNYCMVGLGDSCFVNFCGASVTLDNHFERLAANRVMPLEKLDAYFMPGFQKWKDRFIDLLRQSPQHLPQLSGAL